MYTKPPTPHQTNYAHQVPSKYGILDAIYCIKDAFLPPSICITPSHRILIIDMV